MLITREGGIGLPLLLCSNLAWLSAPNCQLLMCVAPSPWPSPQGEGIRSWIPIVPPYLQIFRHTDRTHESHILLPSPLAGEGLGMRGYASAQAALLTAAACSDGPSPTRISRWHTWRSNAGFADPAGRSPHRQSTDGCGGRGRATARCGPARHRRAGPACAQATQA